MIVFILSLFSSRNKLRVSSLYQLLVGKRTTSVLIFGFTHELLFAHNSFPDLKQDKFYQIMQKLAQQGWIEINENEAKLTSAGADRLSELHTEYTGLRFDRYGRTGETSWRLIKFAVQVISNLASGNQDYLPAETSPFYTFQLKKWLSGSRLPRGILIDSAYESLAQLFSEIPEGAANFLANQFSGNDRTGLLPYQLAKTNDEAAVYLQQSRCTHLLLAQIEERPDSLWYVLIDPLLQQNFNQSMMITKQMFMNGQTIDQIMAIRHLKKGTVTDHLIEWALFFDDFPYERVLSQETVERLEPNKDSVREWRFSEWNVDGQLDYGEFRLYQIYLLRKEAIQNVNK
ncbi:hypothetical protein FAE02_001498 [Enterococcus faecium]|uniref:helix-turn-helix domain-containing protein n=1 Tax=Enterococcus TaxID=1350 RepID=UPI0009BD7CC8|nr:MULTISPECIES: helix-turn-helix domain-containing protein [Enterococcus]EGP4970123.1 hypothetical protein [Enterococcus faecium]EGP5454747.1 hypothetical protein [Enterococcus faecium]MBX4242828.1 helix-turn-helix domain-containing protein [Enterococcus lactis]MBX4246571.1 helix-turn-helix domain-containing protein [Enterococcus lactis]MCH6116742.1 helix-turn-helix domain-containing protein [Enterococcus faecium]